MTFKDLKKRITLETPQQQYKLLDRLRNKPFWIWNIEGHKEVDAKTNGDCCFNHIIGLPRKEENHKPLHDYQRIIFDSLEAVGDNRHLWIKKATGLGISELCSVLWLGFV